MLEEYREKFLFLGKGVKAEGNVTVNRPDKVWLGDKVTLRQNACLAQTKGREEQKLRIKIADRSFVGRNSMLESFNQIILEEDVMLGPFVYISDSRHEYDNPFIPIRYQGFQSFENVLTIKRGAWIGAGAIILGDITIGCGSVIGANSVVSVDIPSHCVVMGHPARIYKIYHYKKKEWIVPDTEDQFLEVMETRGEFPGYDNKMILDYIHKSKKN